MARVQLLLCFTLLFASVTFMEHVSSDTTASSSKSITVSELEVETSKEVMEFIMKLEKKCPPKEEYKSFFEKLKSTMVGSTKVTLEKKKGFFSAAAGKVSDAMSFIGSKLSGKSAEVKKKTNSLLKLFFFLCIQQVYHLLLLLLHDGFVGGGMCDRSRNPWRTTNKRWPSHCKR